MVLRCDMNLQVDIDFEKEPIGTGKDGKSVFFKDIWPSNEEIAEVVDTDPYHILQSAIFICKTLSVGFYLYIEPFLLFIFPWTQTVVLLSMLHLSYGLCPECLSCYVYCPFFLFFGKIPCQFFFLQARLEAYICNLASIIYCSEICVKCSV